jgi:4'-phosphopantetheinyl transferase
MPHRLRFSLSHTTGLVTCLISLGLDSGVDVERSDRRVDALHLAGRWFSVTEVRELQGLAVESRQDRFLDYWTLKEAYMKARGLSSVSLYRDASFAIDGEMIRVTLADQSPDKMSEWWFALSDLPTGHRVAICVHNQLQKKLGVELIHHDITSIDSVRIDVSLTRSPKFGFKTES